MPCRRVLRVGSESNEYPEFDTGEKEMRKLVLIGLMLSLSTGCGRGWLPMFNRGAACNGNSCLGAAPALPPANCEGCGVGTAGYGSYEGEIISSYGGGEVIGSYAAPVYGGVPSTGAITNPPMSTLPSP